MHFISLIELLLHPNFYHRAIFIKTFKRSWFWSLLAILFQTSWPGVICDHDLISSTFHWILERLNLYSSEIPDICLRKIARSFRRQSLRLILFQRGYFIHCINMNQLRLFFFFHHWRNILIQSWGLVRFLPLISNQDDFLLLFFSFLDYLGDIRIRWFQILLYHASMSRWLPLRRVSAILGRHRISRNFLLHSTRNCVSNLL